MRVRLLPYNRGSASARELARRLEVKRISLVRTRFRPRPSDLVVNWGSHLFPNADWATTLGPQWLNNPGEAAKARNKLWAFRRLTENGVPTVEWTDSRQVAETWRRDVHVFCRRSLTGQSGSGIVIVAPTDPYREQLPEAPLYTKRFRARYEYRVHVMACGDFPGAERHHIQQKRRRNGTTGSLVRNHDNGYVYCTEGVDAPRSVHEVAWQAVQALNLSFGAVDILCTTAGASKVLEVNTAPGLEGGTLEFYANRLRRVIDGYRGEAA